MEIKKAELKHAERVSEIYKVLDITEIKLSEIESIKANIKKGRCYIVVHEGKVVAAIVLRLEWGCYEIDSLASEMKGGGSMLVEFAIEKCKEDRIPKLWCWSLKVLDAVGFYQKMGFEEAFLLRKQAFGKDCYILGKVIDLG